MTVFAHNIRRIQGRGYETWYFNLQLFRDLKKNVNTGSQRWPVSMATYHSLWFRNAASFIRLYAAVTYQDQEVWLSDLCNFALLCCCCCLLRRRAPARCSWCGTDSTPCPLWTRAHQGADPLPCYQTWHAMVGRVSWHTRIRRSAAVLTFRSLSPDAGSFNVIWEYYFSDALNSPGELLAALAQECANPVLKAILVFLGSSPPPLKLVLLLRSAWWDVKPRLASWPSMA